MEEQSEDNYYKENSIDVHVVFCEPLRQINVKVIFERIRILKRNEG